MAQAAHVDTPPRLASADSKSYVVQIIPPAEIEREAVAMENLLQSFSLNEPFSLELCGEPKQQRFLLRAESASALRTLCQQVLAQYPQAQLRRIPSAADPLALRDGEHAVVGDLMLRAPTWLPIKTFWNEEMTQTGTDPVVSLLAAMEPVGRGERIICQVALVSAPDTWVQSYKRKAVEHPLDKEKQERQESRAQQKSSDSFKGEGRTILIGLILLLVGGQGYLWYTHHDWQKLALLAVGVLCAFVLYLWWWLHRDRTIYDMQLVSEKLLRVAFYAHVRVIVIGKAASTEKRLRTHLSRLEVAYRQYNLANSNGFQLKRIRRFASGEEGASLLARPSLALPYHGSFARIVHNGWSKVILNAREVSGMWHLLQAEAEVPLVERLMTKKILAHPELFQRIRHTPKAFPPVLIGHSEHRGISVPVYLPEETLFSHKFVIAKSGYGKSTLMQLLLRGAMMPVAPDIKKQPGVVAVDPHGDLIDDLLRQIPRERIHDVILIDLADGDQPPGINLLDATMGFTCDQAVANMMASFSRIWGDSWGPRLAYVLKHVLRSLYTVNEQLVTQGKKEEQYTLIDVNPMLQQPKYARKILALLDKENPYHQKELSFWNDYFFKLPPSFQQEVISPVSNKIGIFSDSHVLERIVGQPVTTINVNESVTKGKIVLVNLASGRLEFDASAIIGATVLNLVHRMLQLQAFIPYPDRRQVFIAVDEFQNIPGADYEAYLSEDRKYGASIMLATQSLIRLEQMKEGLEAMTFSNCAQLFAFATSAEDAEKLEKELHELVTVPHILNQPRLNCYARLALPDQPIQIFSMKLATPEGWKRSPENEAQAAAIRNASRAHHLPADKVDQLLIAHTLRCLDQNVQPAQKQENKQEPKKVAQPPANQPKAPNKPAQNEKPKEPAKPVQNGKPNEKPKEQPKPISNEKPKGPAKPVSNEKPEEPAKSVSNEKPKEQAKLVTNEKSGEPAKPGQNDRPRELNQATQHKKPEDTTTSAQNEKPATSDKPAPKEAEIAQEPRAKITRPFNLAELLSDVGAEEAASIPQVSLQGRGAPMRPSPSHAAPAPTENAQNVAESSKGDESNKGDTGDEPPLREQAELQGAKKRSHPRNKRKKHRPSSATPAATAAADGGST